MVNKKEYKVLVSEDDSGGEEEVRSRVSREISPRLESDSELEESDLEDSGEDHRLLPLTVELSSPSEKRNSQKLKSPEREESGRISRQEADCILGGGSFRATEADFEHNHILGVSNHLYMFC